MTTPATILVTGGTGFLAARCILQALEQGYRVKTSLRSLSRQQEVLQTLQAHGVPSLDQLSFVEADLRRDAHWDEAVAGCTYVLHVAAPIFFTPPKDEREQIELTVEGMLRVLRAAREAGVQRVVLTSSFGAVGFSRHDSRTPTTEADWTDPDLPGLSTYEKAKGLAERVAWQFIEQQGRGLELSVINPVAILGPALSEHVSGSFDMLRHLLDGSLKAVPNIALNVVDVRDVADLHLRAMTSPAAKGQRFIAAADGQISMLEIAQLLREEFPQAAAKVATRQLPNWVLHVAALFNPQARTAAMFLQVSRHVSTAHAQRLLGWQPASTSREAVRAAMRSLLHYHLASVVPA